MRAVGLPSSATRPERLAVASAIGMTAFSYGMLLLGMFKLFYPPAPFAILLIFAVLSVNELIRVGRSLLEVCKIATHASFEVRAAAAVLAVFFLASLCGTFTPPTVFIPGINFTEWDSLSYHLADPKIYMEAHRFVYLAWEDHSNFPFDAEMWYLFGLLEHSVALGKLFHLWCGVIGGLSTYALGCRLKSVRVGLIALVLYAATPFVFWEAGTAYIDLAFTSFVSISLMCLVNATQTGDRKWLRYSAITMGCALGTKTLAVANYALLAVGVFIEQVRVRPVKWASVCTTVVTWSAIAALVGCPWYIKSYVVTGNPVFPLADTIFHTRNWSAEAANWANMYARSFGLGHSASDFMLVPWNVVMYTVDGHSPLLDPLLPSYLSRNPTDIKPFNYYVSVLNTFPPVLITAMFYPFWHRKRLSGLVYSLCVYAAAGALIWFVTMQYARYLMPYLPVICILSALGIDKCGNWTGISRYVLPSALVLSVAFSCFTAVRLIGAIGPVAIGLESRDHFLSATDSEYGVASYINTHLPKNAIIALYGEPKGFYLARRYFWGEPEHGSYIPYADFRSADALDAYFREHGIDYVVVNAISFPTGSTSGYASLVDDLTVRSSPPLFSQSGDSIWKIPAGASLRTKH